MIDEEDELLENFRKLTPENKQQALANIRLVLVTETTVRKAIFEELGIVRAGKDESGEG
jgi:hypothetical protein